MELTVILYIQAVFVLIVIALAIFSIDDLFIDLFALFHGVGPKNISMHALQSASEKKIAIMIANWQEEDVLEQMITGNNDSIIYNNHHFFLGVYPNDVRTLDIAQNLSARYANVHVVLNSKHGPTSKGQMMNEMMAQILKNEDALQSPFDLFVIHDSEDIIHPLSLKLYNKESDVLDFIQIPIFSLGRRLSQFVAGTYMDEFSETHTKELLIRHKLGAAIPSAGVGTCVNRRVVDAMLIENDGYFLHPDSLTEDYILGLQTHLLGFRCGFVCKSVVGLSGREHIIATKEFFPEGFHQSIRQKTRWTVGIVFQGWRILGWTDSLVDNYFLMRDRRGPVNSMVTLIAMLCLIGAVVMPKIITDLYTTPIAYILVLNLVGFTIRAFQRVRHHGIVYATYPIAIIFLRWPVAIVINAFSSVRAGYQFYLSIFKDQKIAWSKTKHKLPKDFGKPAQETV